MPCMEPFQEYLNQERGRLTRVAEALQISSAAISQWDRVPIERVADVSRITGIPREDLRPDIFAPVPDQAA